MLLICLTFISFKYAAMAQINQGVIASLFTSGVIFTSILFYFLYQEQLNFRDVIGIVFILVGVAMIGFGKDNDALDEKSESMVVADFETDLSQEALKWLSILFAVMCGLSFALNSYVMKHYVLKFKFDVI